jgi:hypothetical protein
MTEAIRPEESGLSSWISETLIEATLRIWQPFYAQPLTREDAIEMITTVGRLFSVLSRGDGHEKLCGSGTGEQSGTGT